MAIILMIFGSSLNSLGYIFSNEHRFHPLTTNMVRGFSSIVISYIIARFMNIDMTFPSAHEYKLEFIRNTLILVQCVTYAWSQFYLPLPVAITLQATAPIFTTIADRVINGVKINPKQGFWLLVAFLGVLMTANGQWIYKQITGELASADSKF
jgi:drug/metabolite transporter (DMT)-like permease